MKKNVTRGLSTLALATVLAAGTSSCTKDLDRDPPLNSITTDQIFRDPTIYKSILAKLYGGLNLSGQDLSRELADISADDPGQTVYSRLVWKLQELTADQAIVQWNDGAIQDLNFNTWTSTNNFVQFMYARIYLEVGLCNEYLRETTDDKLSAREITGTAADEARAYRAEARFLRALAYMHAVDFFGNVPFTTESDPVGYFYPQQKSRQEVFNYVESELRAIEDQLPTLQNTVGSINESYGRATKGAAQALLARLYLNAQVYTGTPRWTDCVTYCNRVIAGPYALAPSYRNLFRADNNRTSTSEIIFAITQDGLSSRTYGGTTFLVNAAISGTPRGTQLKGADQGVSGGWGGIRARKTLPLLFGDSATIIQNMNIADQRAFFSTSRVFFGQNSSTDLGNFNYGVTVRKWSNLTSAGVAGSDPGGTFVDTDVPFLRLGDVYLMYAEAVARGGAGGDQGTALGYLNAIRQRAHKDQMGVVQNYPGDIANYDLDYILNERGRELHWEGLRRTDLIRFDRYTGSAYLWPYKGSNVSTNRNGVAIPDFRKLFPIPAAELTANPNIRQNPGY